MSDYSTTKARIFQWTGIVLILAVFAGAYWYFKVYGSTLNAPQNDLNTNGLVGLWSFNGDDISGTTAYDRSGSGNNGTLTNGPEATQGKIGQALNFYPGGTDTNAYVTMGDPAGGQLDFGSGDFSVGFWMKSSGYVNQGSSVNVAVCKKNENLGAMPGFCFVIASNSKMVFEIGDNSFYYSVTQPIATAGDNLWHYYLGIRSGSTMYLYVDGMSAGSAAVAGSISNTNIFVVGTDEANPTARNANISVDEIRAYNRALAAGEIQSLYAQGGGTKIDSAVSQPQGTGRLDSGLAGYWPLDDGSGTSAMDSSTNGNNAGFINTPTWTTGQIGGALDFTDPLENQSLSVGDVLDMPDGANFSIAGWFYRSTFNTIDIIFAKTAGLGAGYTGYGVYIDDASDALVFLGADGTDIYTLTSSSTFTGTGWNHFVAVWNDTSANETKLYINGKLESATASGTFANVGSMSNVDPIHIGSESDIFTNNDRSFRGKLDEVRVYNRTLSADEVSQLYRLSAPTSVDTGLKGYWSFNGKDLSGATAYDRSGVGNNATLTNSPAVTRGKLGQALDFNGTSQYGTLGPSNTYIPSASSPFALSVWFKASSIGGSSNINRILSMRNGGSSAIILGVGSTNQVQFYNSGTATHYNVATVSTGQWYHYVLTYNGTAFQPYIDGIAQGSPITATGPTTNSIAATLGTFGGSDFFFAGSIDEVRIYNRALTAAEIKGLYDVGADDKTNSSVSQPQGTGRLDSGLAGYWPLDNGSGTSATDSSTNGNTGTLTNGPTWTTGQIGGAVTFDGTDDRIVTTHTTNLNTYPITVSTWVKTSVNDATRRPIVSKYSFLNGYALYMSGGKVLAWYMGNGSNYVYTGAEGITSTTTVSDNAWHNVVFTVDIVGGKLYVDGKLEASRAWTGTPQAPTTTNGLGLSYPDGGSFTAYLAASIDDTRIYNRALSTEEVAQLYRLNAPTGTETGLKGYWSFNGKDLSSTTAYDRSGAGNNGTLTGPVITEGKIGQGLSFDGVNDYVDLGTGSSIRYTTTGSIAVWVKTSCTGTCVIIGGNSDTEIGYNLFLESGTLKYRQNKFNEMSTPWTGVYNDGNWHFVVVSKSGANGTLYVDNVSKATSTGLTGSWGAHAIYLGNEYNRTYYFSGIMDEVRVYDRALTTAEIASLYNSSR